MRAAGCTQHTEVLCAAQAPKRNSALREAAILAVPTVFDLAAMVLMNVGLLSVTASVYQMVRHLWKPIQSVPALWPAGADSVAAPPNVAVLH